MTGAKIKFSYIFSHTLIINFQTPQIASIITCYFTIIVESNLRFCKKNLTPYNLALQEQSLVYMFESFIKYNAR